MEAPSKPLSMDHGNVASRDARIAGACQEREGGGEELDLGPRYAPQGAWKGIGKRHAQALRDRGGQLFGHVARRCNDATPHRQGSEPW